MVKKDLAQLSPQYIKGVGPQRVKVLARLGIKTVLDAIYCLPYRYEDRRNIRKIRDLSPPQPPPLLKGVTDPMAEGTALQTVMGRVIGMDVINAGRLKIFELRVSDGSGVMAGKWFNQPFIKKRFAVGQEIVLSGIVKYPYRGSHMEMENPEYEFITGDDADSLIHMGRIVPVYRATEGISSRQLRGIIHNALKTHLSDIPDPIPEEILKRNSLPGLAKGIMGCHFPEDEDITLLNSWQAGCQRRLCFDELFKFQFGLAALRAGRGKEQGIVFDSTNDLIPGLRKALLFNLTSAQERALSEILEDMRQPHPMTRLLQGDVGSGKTVVALMAMLRAVECGFQAAIMAPTEILAEQHYINIHGLLEGLGLKVCLLTGSIKGGKRPLSDILKAKVNIVVGTHALLEEGIRFGKLGLIVIDEQHRFGVRQRAVLRKKSKNPDVLIMTATPIPRTLAMTLYGDLDCSVIDSLPPGRTPVASRVVMSGEKEKIYEAITSEVKGGGQAYVVYPLIEESEKLSLKSAILGAETLKKRFPAMRVSLIHGRMKPAERESSMMDFKRGLIDILVSTTVIEVGVDVPNASLMVIVHAERFGLSQLHQLRGRVGRGRRQSRCLLLAYPPMSDVARRRLDTMVRTTDGFRVAEEDLAIRGPGEFMGVRQSGMPDLKIADIVRDAGLLGIARKEAFSLMEKDYNISGYPLLKEAIEEFWKGKIELFKTA